MRLLRAADYRRMPWKNGGGGTAEIAVSPPDAGLAAFDWRVSMATVAQSGPFSPFPGIDRTLTLLQGAGITLEFSGAASTSLLPGSAPCPFSGDLACEGRLLDGPILDLNVMSRRGAWSHAVNALRGSGQIARTPANGVTMLVAEGPASITDVDRSWALEALDTVIVDGQTGVLTFACTGKARLFHIMLQPGA